MLEVGWIGHAAMGNRPWTSMTVTPSDTPAKACDTPQPGHATPQPSHATPQHATATPPRGSGGRLGLQTSSVHKTVWHTPLFHRF